MRPTRNHELGSALEALARGRGRAVKSRQIDRFLAAAWSRAIIPSTPCASNASFFFITGLLLLSGLQVGASPLNEGIAALNEGRPFESAPAVKPLAAKGVPEAQFGLGVVYREGKGVAKNTRLAAELFCSAAQKGGSDAEYNCGLVKALGEGTPQNFEEAAKWWKLAAAQGDVRAQHNLGLLYMEGNGVDTIESQAKIWFQKAAEKGIPQAQYNLAMMYYSGKGAARDLKQAARWFRLASEQGDAESRYTLGRMYMDGQGVDRDYKEAEELLRLAASSGLDKAQEALGKLLLMKSAEKLKPDADSMRDAVGLILPITTLSACICPRGFRVHEFSDSSCIRRKSQSGGQALARHARDRKRHVDASATSHTPVSIVQGESGCEQK